MVPERSEPAHLNGRTIALIHFGGLGDVVLLADCVARFKASEPETRIVVLCRAEFAPATSCYSVRADRVVPIDIDPYGAPAAAVAVLDVARAAFDAVEERVDLVICAELRPTWLSFIAIERLQPASVRMVDATNPPWLSAHLDTERLSRMEWTVVGDADRGIFRALAPDVEVEGLRLSIHPSLIDEARATIAHDNGKASIAIFPFCEPRVPYKAWPLERFERLTAYAIDVLDKNVLLVGGLQEAAQLVMLRGRSSTPDRIRTFAGARHELPLCFALLSLAESFVGNDTGLSHAAAAVGRPGVTLFGGGFWPAYAPHADGSIGVVAPMPCFGCGWDCAFDRGLCVEAISFEAAIEQLTCLERGLPARTIVLDVWSDREREVVASAATRHRAATEKSRQELADREQRIGILEVAATERLDALIATSERNEKVEVALQIDRIAEGEYDRKLAALQTRVEALDAVAYERLVALERNSEEAKHTAAAYADSRTNLEATCASLRSELDETRAVASALEASEATCVSLRAQLDESNAVAAARLVEIERGADEAKRAASAFGSALEASKATCASLRARLAESDAVSAQRLAELERSGEEARQGASAFASALEASEATCASLRARLEESDAVAAQRLADLERSAEEARQAASAFGSALEVSETTCASLRRQLHDATEAATQRLTELERVSNEAQLVYAEAEKRSVIIADLTGLVESQHRQIQALHRRPAG